MPAKTKVLYIEDDVASRRLVQRVLENHEYDVLIAREGLEGIELARNEEPDLILIDINLPGMNGREITTRLRSLPNFRDTPIVALTANTSPGHRERALAVGCDGFLTKPIDVVNFPKEVQSFLEGYRERLDTEEKLAHLEQHAQQVVQRLEHKVHELEEANRRLRELDRMKSDFIVLVSHELRTPLTLLEGYAHLLEERLGSEALNGYAADTLPLIKGLDSGVKRISEVVSEVINVSRIASGTLQLSLGPVRLAEIVERVTARLSDIFAKRNLQLEIDDFSHLPVIQADGVQLEIALRNVLGNAIKYTPDGGKITVSGRLMGDAVDLVVRDTGIGIPAEEQRRIFDQFYVLEAIEHHSTSKSAFQGGGLGLGLAITKGIVEAHNGRIWVKSRSRNPEQLPGSAFHILLPVAQSHG